MNTTTNWDQGGWRRQGDSGGIIKLHSGESFDAQAAWLEILGPSDPTRIQKPKAEQLDPTPTQPVVAQQIAGRLLPAALREAS